MLAMDLVMMRSSTRGCPDLLTQRWHVSAHGLRQYLASLYQKNLLNYKKCDMNYKLKRDDIKRKEHAIKQRLDKAMSDLMREKSQKDYEKPGRHGSEEKTKVPPKGYRGILEWKDNIPVGDWAVKFNNLIGYLIRDPRSINIAHNFEEQEFKCIKKIWEKLMDHYCLKDNPESWDYVIPKMAKLIRCWKSDLKKRYFTYLSTDWKRIYELDKRVPPFNWMTLIIEWEGEKKKICETTSVNRRSKLYDHFLGATPYVQIEHKYLNKNPAALEASQNDVFTRATQS
ncbi:uncharacterized protein LOC109824004 isoform X1 [Asparagus officinalis]|uniref:uncharacterized protein LOC109824004 isoform X1 n=1 Tax=Asparagus officinalis TaxID=4686 RepID=UPI00098E1003|nr:uncharacterized protein LOC109824004 isoform X1 [Asparagus officinalis]XP_020246090.1 uncharacterized protein LOC109824004 isoform X1 [Asparagus officinalis]XP_020246091.1 uncharacterized protein LOC109824004 isoform X1 [Asparagus officinalis]